MALRPKAGLNAAVLMLRRRIAELERRVEELEAAKKEAPPSDATQRHPPPPPVLYQQPPAAKQPASPARSPVPEAGARRPYSPPEPARPEPPPQPRPPALAKPREPGPLDAVWRWVAPPRRPGVSMEVDLATRWLPRIGGLLVIIGAALAAPYIQPSITPLGRVAIGFAFAAGLLGLGYFAQRRNVIVGRSLIATGMALGFFVSFASYFIPETRVFTVFLPAFILMAGFAGTLMGLADRWRSEAAGVLGLLLGVVASLVSAASSQTYTLVGLVVLALAAGVLLVRREWLALTGMAVLCTYGGTVILWYFFPPVVEAEAASHLAALLLYHLVFAVAFFKWSERWLAREAKIETRTGSGSLGYASEVIRLPFSSTYAIFNSLALIGLSVLVLYISRIWWQYLDTLFFWLAAMEATRLLIPRLRAGMLWHFHLLTAAVLTVAGTITALEGTAEMLALSVQILVLSIAAGRIPSLRFLMPFAFIPAGRTLEGLSHFFTGGEGAPVAEIASSLMLLASAMPWDKFLGGEPPLQSWLLHYMERSSAHLRSFCAGLLLLVPLLELSERHLENEVHALPGFLVLLSLLLAGAIALGARAWASTILIGTIAFLGMLQELRGEANLVLLFSGLAVVLLVRLWQDFLRLYGFGVAASLYYAGLILAFFLLCVSAYDATLPTIPWHGAVLFGFACAIVAAGVFAPSMNVPRLAKVKDVYSEGAAGWKWSWRDVAVPRPTIVAGTMLGILGIVAALFEDAREALWSPLILALVLMGAWYLVPGRMRGTLFFVTAYLVATFGFTIFGEGLPWTSAVWLALMLLLFPLTLENRKAEAAFLQLVPAAVAVIMAMGFLDRSDHQFQDWLTGAACCIALLNVPLLYRLAERRGVGFSIFVMGKQSTCTPLVTLVVALSGLLLLYLWTLGEFLPGRAVTMAWALTGMFVLFLGFVLRESIMRYIAMGLLVITTVRIFFVDLAQADTLTKVIAFVVTGIVYIVAGMAYVFLRKLAAGSTEQ